MALTIADLAQLTARRTGTYQCQGAAHHNAKLSDARVREMRERFAEWREEDEFVEPKLKRGYQALAATFGCSWPTARDIVKGYTRREAGGPLQKRRGHV